MWRHVTPARLASRLSAEVLALQGIAEHAGCALACRFSSSEEYEAALIRSRRAAGAYGRPRRWRYALYAGAATGALALTLWMI
jgi:hypothetical protein